MLKIAIFGRGQNGAGLIRCARRLDNLNVVAAVESADHPFIGKDAGIVAGTMDIGVPVSDDAAGSGQGRRAD